MKTKITIPELLQLKREGKKFKMITVYDYPLALTVDKSSTELILVGDSLGMVIQGFDSTIPVNIEDMIYIYVKAVKRGTPNTFIVGDMSFLSYQESSEKAIHNAGMLLKAGADCVKLEGMNIANRIKDVVNAGIPTMAHIGLTPTVAMMGGFKKPMDIH